MDNLLWSEEDIRVSPDGFLLIVDPNAYSLSEEQPLLLHTTSALLRELYPSREIPDVILRSGFESEEISTQSEGCVDDSISPADENQKRENDVKVGKTIPAEYKPYQGLDRVENLPNWIHSALSDIRNFRHRVVGCRSSSSRGSKRIRALQIQQNHIIRSNSDTNCENSETGGQNVVNKLDQREQKQTSEECVSGDGGENDANDARLEEEPVVIKLARTINSIRALFPHLLPILNHRRRNDKNLVIGKIRYKTRRNGSMCWLLGTESYSSCTLKQVTSAQDATREILETFIDIEPAAEISMDPEGSPAYWSSLWIEHIVKRSNPALPSPLMVLATNSSISEECIENTALFCNEIIAAREKASTEGLDQQYKKAVRKIHQRLSNVLMSRFHGARVSICILFVGLHVSCLNQFLSHISYSDIHAQLSIYGSCLSNLAIGKGSDVDMSLWIPAADSLKKDFDNGRIDARQYDQCMKKLVFQVFRKLSKLKAEFRGMTPITNARIPVITGTYIYAGNPYTEDKSIE